MGDRLEGGCQCGAIRYRVTGAPVTFYACHCTECQKQSASAFGLSLWVGRSDLQFVRNGKMHTAGEAARHMRRKYEYFAERIASAEDFIELAATKSLISGKLYTVRTASGELLTAEWLQNALAEYRHSREPGTVEST